MGEWYYGYLGGIRPDPEVPGFKRTIIKPLPAEGLDWAKANMETAYGSLSTSWHKTADQFQLDVVIPPNTRAEIHFPVGPDKRITESGVEIYADRKLTADADLFTLHEGSGEEIILEVGAGDYFFVVE